MLLEAVVTWENKSKKKSKKGEKGEKNNKKTATGGCEWSQRICRLRLGPLYLESCFSPALTVTLMQHWHYHGRLEAALDKVWEQRKAERPSKGKKAEKKKGKVQENMKGKGGGGDQNQVEQANKTDKKKNKKMERKEGKKTEKEERQRRLQQTKQTKKEKETRLVRSDSGGRKSSQETNWSCAIFTVRNRSSGMALARPEYRLEELGFRKRGLHFIGMSSWGRSMWVVCATT